VNNNLEFLYKRVFRKGDNPERIKQKVCQDIFISKLSNTEFFHDKIIFKDGIVMYKLTRGKRGYTKDIDIDFIKYPISIEGTTQFVFELNESKKYSNIVIDIESSEELSHKGYNGRRVKLLFIDKDKTKYKLSVDIGVHLDKVSLPETRAYEIRFEKLQVDILIDSNNLSIVEKLSTFALYGVDNVRYRDLFDVYWRIKYLDFEIASIKTIFDNKLVLKGPYKSRKLAINVIIKTLQDKKYIKELENEDNWTSETIKDICHFVTDFLQSKLV